jgi:hypothetical protein
MRAHILTVLLAIGMATAFGQTRPDRCAVCNQPFGEWMYSKTDKVTDERKDVCQTCAHLTTICFLCGMPAKNNFKTLPDGRILCERDAKGVVLEAEETRQIFREVAATMERQFMRFTTFPENIEVRPLDRVDLMTMFRVPGFDYTCPNIWGCTTRTTNENGVVHSISLLQGLPAYQLRATSAHELTHTWITENVSPRRKRQMDQDAVEGFCELMAYLYAEAQSDAASMGNIQSNTYTRGQFPVFLAAERRYGFNDVMEWMKFGVDPRLTDEDLGRVRTVQMPAAAKGGSPSGVIATLTAMRAAAPPPVPNKLTLKSISGPPNRRFALINDKTFAPLESGRVHVGESNVLVRCLEIRTNSVLIQIEGASEKQELSLGGN